MTMPNIQTHTEDPRVAIVTCLADFKVAVNNAAYQAIIIRRPEEEIAAAKAAIEKVANAETADKSLFQMACSVRIKTKSIETTTGAGAKSLRSSCEIKAEISTMSKYWRAAHGPSTIEATIFRGYPSVNPHPHDFPVLNSAWNCATGTTWAPPETDANDPANHTLNTRPGDMFYMKPNFMHASPPAPSKNNATTKSRLLFICMPVDLN